MSGITSTGLGLSKSKAMAATRGHRFVGYAVRVDHGWTCVVYCGAGWTTLRCARTEEVRVTMRSTAGADSFEWFQEMQILDELLQTLPSEQRPDIRLSDVVGRTTELGSSLVMRGSMTPPVPRA